MYAFSVKNICFSYVGDDNNSDSSDNTTIIIAVVVVVCFVVVVVIIVVTAMFCVRKKKKTTRYEAKDSSNEYSEHPRFFDFLQLIIIIHNYDTHVHVPHTVYTVCMA